jgi:acetyl esterase/lipase
MSGHSSGAHLALLTAMDPRFLAERGKSAAQVAGLIGLSGVYDVQAEYDHWAAKGITPELIGQVMGGTEHFPAASPQSYARTGLPPVLLIHGDRDALVPVAQATGMHAALQEAGARSELLILRGAWHTDFLFDALTRDTRGLVATIAQFVMHA